MAQLLFFARLQIGLAKYSLCTDNMELRQTLRNHILTLQYVLFLLCAYIVIGWFYNYSKEYLIGVGLLLSVLSIFPASYLHIEYMTKNWGCMIKIESDRVLVTDNRIEKAYQIVDLEKVTVYMSANYDGRKNFRLSALDDYFYARVLAKNGDEIIITCLLTRDIHQVVYMLKGVPAYRVKKLFNPIEKV